MVLINLLYQYMSSLYQPNLNRSESNKNKFNNSFTSRLTYNISTI